MCATAKSVGDSSKLHGGKAACDLFLALVCFIYIEPRCIGGSAFTCDAEQDAALLTLSLVQKRSDAGKG